MAAPLRGELTLTAPSSEGVPSDFQNIQPVLMQLFRLTSNLSSGSLSSPSIYPSDVMSRSLGAKATDIWTPTDSDTAQTYGAILPFLIHVAAAKNDVEGIQFCIDAWEQLTKLEDKEAQPSSPVVEKSFLQSVGSGICNVLDTSGRSPLHTAALNGSLESTRLLLQNGASVHSRDLLDHTMLYYVSDQTVQKRGGKRVTDMMECAGYAAGP